MTNLEKSLFWVPREVSDNKMGIVEGPPATTELDVDLIVLVPLIDGKSVATSSDCTETVAFDKLARLLWVSFSNSCIGKVS